MNDLIPDLIARLAADDGLGYATVERYADHLDPKRVVQLSREVPACYVVGGDFVRGADNRATVYLLLVAESPALDRTAAARTAIERADDLGDWLETNAWEFAPWRIDLDAGIAGSTAHSGDRFAVASLAVPFVPA